MGKTGRNGNQIYFARGGDTNTNPPRSSSEHSTLDHTSDRSGRSATSGKTIRVLLVDEPAVRRGVRMLLDLEPDVVVVGEAGDADRAMALAADLGPCVAIVDIASLGDAGAETIAGLRQVDPQLAVIVLSLKDDRLSRATALAAGTVRFVCKDEGPEALMGALRNAAGLEHQPADRQKR